MAVTWPTFAKKKKDDGQIVGVLLLAKMTLGNTSGLARGGGGGSLLVLPIHDFRELRIR